MTGIDSEGAGPFTQAELDTFRQDIVNEVVQLQAALQRTVDYIVDAKRQSAPGGGGKVPAGSDHNPPSPRPGHRRRATAPPAPPCSAS